MATGGDSASQVLQGLDEGMNVEHHCLPWKFTPPREHPEVQQDPALSVLKGAPSSLNAKHIPYRIQTKRNHFASGIHSLPVEVLGRIMELSHSSDLAGVEYAFAVSQVCTRFRAIAHRTPLLWSTICNVLPQEFLQLFISRSRNFPLTIILKGLGRSQYWAWDDIDGYPDDGSVLKFLNLVFKHAARCTKLIISGDGEFCEMVTEHIKTAFGPSRPAKRSRTTFPHITHVELDISPKAVLDVIADEKVKGYDVDASGDASDADGDANPEERVLVEERVVYNNDIPYDLKHSKLLHILRIPSISHLSVTNSFPTLMPQTMDAISDLKVTLRDDNITGCRSLSMLPESLQHFNTLSNLSLEFDGVKQPTRQIACNWYWNLDRKKCNLPIVQSFALTVKGKPEDIGVIAWVQDCIQLPGLVSASYDLQVEGGMGQFALMEAALAKGMESFALRSSDPPPRWMNDTLMCLMEYWCNPGDEWRAGRDGRMEVWRPLNNRAREIEHRWCRITTMEERRSGRRRFSMRVPRPENPKICDGEPPRSVELEGMQFWSKFADMRIFRRFERVPRDITLKECTFANKAYLDSLVAFFRNAALASRDVGANAGNTLVPGGGLRVVHPEYVVTLKKCHCLGMDDWEFERILTQEMNFVRVGEAWKTCQLRI